MTIFLEDTEIPVGEFKTHCLKLIEQVHRSHVPLTLTKRGKPVAKLVPLVEEEAPSVFGCMRGTITIHGDIVEPIDVVWNATVE